MDWIWNLSFMDRFVYLRKRTNWHKASFISKILCWLGRHNNIPYLLEDNCVWMECSECKAHNDFDCRHVNTKIH